MTRDPLVTVCVPAYRSERYIAHTLASIAAQTFRDFRVRIALEPIAEGPTVDACRPFLEDPRFELVINDRQLGWDGNVAELLASVRSPLYCVQPHDDLLRPAYLEELVGMVMCRPDASVAYSDVLSFGSSSGRRGGMLPDDPRRSARELGYFLDGAQGHPFRGVSRSTVLTRRFPTNEHRGFAVETEWALHLAQQGVALRGPRPLYLKRQPGRTDATSVTVGWRFGMSRDEMVAALEHNRARLVAAIGPAEPGGVPREVVELAAEAAMLRRWQMIPGEPLPFGDVQLARARDVLAATGAGRHPAAPRIAAITHVALSRHHAATGDGAAGLSAARDAVRCDPSDTEACLRLAQLLLATGEHDEAIDLIERAASSAPLDDGVLRLLGAATSVLDRRYAAIVPPAPPQVVTG